MSYIYRVYTVIRLRGRTPDAGSDPPFAPPCKRNTPAPIAGSDPPFALLLKGRVRPPDAGSDTAFFVCVNGMPGLPPQCTDLTV